MTREQCKELLPAIKHFANGGNLWSYDGKELFKQVGIISDGSADKTNNIIEDKHFETRKHFALGGEVEWLSLHGWELTKSPAWEINVEYRPKPKEPEYEWQWLFKINKSRYAITGDFYSEVAAELEWIKFEPSKRRTNDQNRM